MPLFVSYRRVTAVTGRDKYLIGRCMNAFDCMSCINFYTLDPNQVYCKPEKDNTELNKSAFIKYHWLYTIVKMMFGLGDVLGRSK